MNSNKFEKKEKDLEIYFFFDELDSTNTAAHRLIESNLCSKNKITIIQSNSQKKGYGRRGTQWVSVGGNLYVSLIVPISMVKNSVELGMISAISMTETITHLFQDQKKRAGDRFFIKWPNDWYVINQKILKKIGGQLIEKNEDFLILGVGFNVKNSPQLIDQPTICLDDLGKVINPFFLLHFFLKNFLSLFLSQKPNSFECLRQRWLKHALGYNVENAIMIDDCVDCFTFIDIAKDGALVLFNAKNNTFKRKYDIERIKFYTPSLIC